MEAPRISTRYLHWLHDYVRSRGLDPAPVLGPLPSCEREPFVAMAEWRARLDAASGLLGDADLGLHFGQTIGPYRFGVLGYLLHHCDNVAQVLMRAWHFRELFFHLQHVEPRWQRDEVQVCWRLDGTATHFHEEVFAVVATVQIARVITGLPLAPLAVGLMNEAQGNQAELAAFLRCPVEYGQDAIWIRAPTSIFALTTAQPDVALCELLERQAVAMLAALPEEDELVSDVRRHIVALLADGEPAQQRVAARMHLSSRTLHRRLAQRNRRFRDVLEQARRQLAESYLHDPDLTLPDIALLLGYTEQSTFTHAFRRWTGMAPLAWRRQQGVPANGGRGGSRSG
jgi:AraC-like DNA-binding protein